jgi:D-amino peptidase
MEGIAGIGHEEATDPYRSAVAPDYAMARQLMTGEANAAIRGARRAGATEILVNDSHWHMRNLLPEDLERDAILATGSPKPQAMLDGVQGFDAAIFVGYHARAGTAPATIDHTYNGTVYDVRLNGVPSGEIGLNAALAGWYDVPVVLVSGDDAACAEAAALLGSDLVTVPVKQAVGRHAVRSVHPGVARDRIERGVIDALQRRHLPLRLTAPITIEVDFVRTHHADMAELAPGSHRLAPRTVAFTHVEYPEVFRAWRAMYNLATVD